MSLTLLNSFGVGTISTSQIWKLKLGTVTMNYSFFFLKGFYFCGELCSTNVYLDEDTWDIETRLGSGEKWNHI